MGSLRIVAGLAALGWASVLWGQSSSDGALRAVSGSSPFLGCVADEMPAVRGRFYLGSEVEPRLAISPKNPRNLVAAFQQDRWSNGGARGLVAGVSLDGGASWRSVVVPGISLCSGGTWARVSDPWVSFGPNGDVFLSSLAVDHDFWGDVRERHGEGPPEPRLPSSTARGYGPASPNAILVSRSRDGGLTWGDPVTLVRSDGSFNDKESVTADPYDPRFVYVVWDRAEGGVTDEGFIGDRQTALFSRTTDGGATWEPARVIYDPGPGGYTVGHQIVVLPDGTLLDFFSEVVPRTAPDGELFWVFYGSLLRSTDKGTTWGPVHRGFPMSAPKILDPDLGIPVRHGAGLFDVAVDPVRGYLYVVFASRDPGNNLGISTDGGRTWGIYLNIGVRGRDLPQPFTPTVRVTARGTVGISFYDFRSNDARRGALVDHWLIRCDGPLECSRGRSRETRLTDGPFDIEQAPYAFGLFLGDYQGLVTDGEDFLALFAQTHGADPASIFFRRIRP